MNNEELKAFLDDKAEQYNSVEFIATDPISIPHQFSSPKDIEISAFLIAIIAWGNRKAILKSGEKILKIMDYSPFDFIVNHSPSDLKACDGFVHRTFNATDLKFFFQRLQQLYQTYGSLEDFLTLKHKTGQLQLTLHHFKQSFFNMPHEKRTEKHLSDPLKNSAAKRLNMLLRWFVRKDNNGVDFGIWKQIKPYELSCPLDVHSGRVARKLGLLNRQQTDAKAVKELDNKLRQLDPEDPAKYDFALFGLGVFEQF
ncbi:TIGR02757 family protein [Psychroflexus sp. ALD_RP9]|uniref:TIGR02757 family protein n=1 Tax=Psychroflexus sp. ALD_RP9 TaxID=2777186 RepID=UPI001A9046BC|nr:TIGR02757 family protein [Psychroflexus sp. ALD_RP9]QSS96837.1 TIGR02757 family protein [Psychroflexus sp. ALD_RP9]